MIECVLAWQVQSLMLLRWRTSFARPRLVSLFRVHNAVTEAEFGAYAKDHGLDGTPHRAARCRLICVGYCLQPSATLSRSFTAPRHTPQCRSRRTTLTSFGVAAPCRTFNPSSSDCDHPTFCWFLTICRACAVGLQAMRSSPTIMLSATPVAAALACIQCWW